MIEVDNKSSIFNIFSVFKKHNHFIIRWFFWSIKRYWVITSTFNRQKKVYIDFRTSSAKEIDQFLELLYNINFHADICNLINADLRTSNRSYYEYMFRKIYLLDEKEYLSERMIEELVS